MSSIGTERTERRSAFMGYTTLDERLFIHRLAQKNPKALRNYADIVNSGLRRFDPGVDVVAVRGILARALYATDPPPKYHPMVIS